jgi:hypothetical protein
MQNINIDELVDMYINKANLNINNIIQETIANKKHITLPHDKLIDKLMSLDTVRDIEDQITTDILKQMNLNQYNTDLVIKTKQLKQKKVLKTDISIDSDRLLDILIDEIILAKDKAKLGNFIGDLSNFQSELIVSHFKFFELLKSVQKYISSSSSFMITNVINFFNKVIKSKDVHVLVESLIIFLNYLNNNLDNFYKTNFDITKFYDISLNVELLNNFILALNSMFIRRIDEEKFLIAIDQLFKAVLKNYENDYLYGNKSSDKLNTFGISTNYTLILLFSFGHDLSLFKILFKKNAFRSYCLSNYNKIDFLIFINKSEMLRSFNTKNCFLWKHYSILEQIFPNKKISKKYLLYSWTAIRIHFLGFVMRYNSLKTNFLKMNDLSCSIVFGNLVLFCKDIKTELDLDEGLYFEIFYLIKEVLCDIILYCNNPECLNSKYKIMNELDTKDKLIIKLLDDLALAFNNNFKFN